MAVQNFDKLNNIQRKDRHIPYDEWFGEITKLGEQEIAQRQQFGYTPFTKIINIYLKHKQDDVVLEMAVRYSNMLRKVFGGRVLGPEAPMVPRVQNMYIRQIVLKMELSVSMTKVKKILRDLYEQLLAADSRMRSTRLYFDVDPA